MKNSKGTVIVAIISVALLGTAAYFLIKGLKKPKDSKIKGGGSTKGGGTTTTTGGTTTGGTTTGGSTVLEDDILADDTTITNTTTTTSGGTSTSTGGGGIVVGAVVQPKRPSKPRAYITKNSLPFVVGNRSEYIKTLQRKLGVGVDGAFGLETWDAVVNFQNKNNIKVDGIVGTETWKVLFGKNFPNT